jgi:hypothetical protein
MTSQQVFERARDGFGWPLSTWRKKVRRVFGAALLALAMFAGAPATMASADPGTPPPDPGDVVLILTSPSGPAVPVNPFKPKPGGPLDPCDTESGTIWGQNAYGEVLWRLQMNINWCWDYSTVTYVYRWQTISVGGYGWRDFGTVSDSNSEPPTGAAQYQAFHEHHFARCYISPWGEVCVDHTYPYVNMTVTNYGGWSSSAGTY